MARCTRRRPTGTFLNGITRQRVIALLRQAGYAVHERALCKQDFRDADEIFSTGNYAKVLPINRIEARDIQPGPIYTEARRLYWEFAHGGWTAARVPKSWAAIGRNRGIR